MVATQANVKPKQEAQLALLPQFLYLKDGLPPLKQAREFTLRVEEQSPPFLRLDCVNLNLSYILIDPFLIFPEYAPEFSDADCNEIGLLPSDKPLVLSIVNFSRGCDQASANLVGPLLIDPKTGKARQAILLNSNKYTSRYQLIG